MNPSEKKLSSFDHALLDFLVYGESSFSDAAAKLRVSERDVKKRASELKKAGFLAQDSFDKKRYRLTILGYEEHSRSSTFPDSPPPEKKHFRDTAREGRESSGKQQSETFRSIPRSSRDPVQQPLFVGLPPEPKVDVFSILSGDPGKISPITAKNEVSWASRNASGASSPPSSENPLISPQKKGSSRQEQARPQVSSPPTSRPLFPDQPKSKKKEVCALCKSDFKISVKEPGLAKYGHCFCGAPYHKECYDAIVSGENKCVVCGRPLIQNGKTKSKGDFEIEDMDL